MKATGDTLSLRGNFLFKIINYSFLTSWSIFHGEELLVTLSKVLQHFTNLKKSASDRL